MMILETLKQLAAQVRGENQREFSSNSAGLAHELSFSSLEMLEFMLAVESTFSIQIDYSQLNFCEVQTLESFERYLVRAHPDICGKPLRGTMCHG